MEPFLLIRRFARHLGAVVFGAAVASCIPLMAAADTASTPDVSGVMVVQGWSRPTPPGAAVGVGYMIIHNHTDAAVRLTGVTTEVAARVSIHEALADNGMMRMKPLPDGLSIDSGQSVEFKPLSYHLMLEGLKEPLKVGQKIPVTLNFERIPAQNAVLDVRSLDDAGEDDVGMNHSTMNHSTTAHSNMDHSGMNHSDMDH
ncbi:MAG: copper chaperone PCu(A)C [Marinobacter sp.]